MIVGTGVDVVDIERFRKVIERSSDRFLLRVFTENERQFCAGHRDPIPHYAVRFAAKEAVFKALGTGWAKGVTWLDVAVLREHAQPPSILLSGEAQKRAGAMGVQKIHLSLSHSDQSAVAMVVME